MDDAGEEGGGEGGDGEFEVGVGVGGIGREELGNVAEAANHAEEGEDTCADDAVPVHAEGEGGADEETTAEGECALEKGHGFFFGQDGSGPEAEGEDDEAGEEEGEAHGGRMIGAWGLGKRGVNLAGRAISKIFPPH